MSSVTAARVLVVDDDRDTVLTVVSRLEIAGHACSVAYSGEDALQLCAMQCFDCLVIDYRLGGMSGLSVAEALAGSERRPRRIVLITGRGIEDFIESIETGVLDAYLQKPLFSEELTDLVRLSVSADPRSNVLAFRAPPPH